MNPALKTLNDLEKYDLSTLEFDSHLLRKIHKLWSIPIHNFTASDLRILIGQNIALKYLIPFALNILDKDPFVEADFYEGDLLESVSKCELHFWIENPQLKLHLKNIIDQNITEINARKLDRQSRIVM
ncbi:contact-dependent growth inhibition system immunity protein [Runella salmonicolor]|uniref:Contact-dependent growth inhibition system immunity protein n=1 Tax=Runella salmonicolor TaxID=2950278 RepID=A0ABT1G095_9BACT|nr:contact-dependent growth inhibition system immunity protein [Runella salmonicolor]MCP1386147.1 contact-dependent growth inhibition system immunity protein [Runella salmonicolor]